jgi:formate hydrogenlyase subunit 3/multisubunit Na+/H+ antiporter MnhD subunit
MITALCIIGYIVMIFVTAVFCHKFFEMEKDEALGLGFIWPAAIFIGICLLIMLPFWWIGEKIIELWNYIEDRNRK